MKNGAKNSRLLGFGLPGDAGNQGITGDTVADGADGTAAQNEPAADQAPEMMVGLLPFLISSWIAGRLLPVVCGGSVEYALSKTF